MDKPVNSNQPLDRSAQLSERLRLIQENIRQLSQQGMVFPEQLQELHAQLEITLEEYEQTSPQAFEVDLTYHRNYFN